MKTQNVKPNRNGYIKISRADFWTIGGLANAWVYTTDVGCYVAEGYQGHKEYLKLLKGRKTYSRF